MKTLIKNYIFIPTTKQIVFSDLTLVGLEDLLIITNVTTNKIIYNFADPSCGGAVLGNVLTLTYNTTNMNETDKLQIFMESTEQTQDYENLLILLKRLVKLNEPLGAVSANNLQRVFIDNTVTVGVSGQVLSTAANQTNSPLGNPYIASTSQSYLGVTEGPIDQRWRIINESRNAFANGIRSKLT